MHSIVVGGHFSAAHRLRNHPGPCCRLHGHNFRVEIEISGPRLDAAGMLVDFLQLDRELRALLRTLDHRCLDNVPPFDAQAATAENLSAYIADELTRRLPLPADVRLQRVTVWESEAYRASFTPD